MSRKASTKDSSSTANLGFEADIGKEHADTFRHIQHPDLGADYVLVNLPFNDFDWFRKDDDVRWQFTVQAGNSNIFGYD